MAVTQGILGVSADYDGLRIDPCISTKWPSFEVVRRFRGTEYHIVVRNPDGVSRGVKQMTINGKVLAGNVVPLAKTGRVEVEVTLG